MNVVLCEHSALCKGMYVWDYDFIEASNVVIWLRVVDLVLEGGSGAQCTNLLSGAKLDSLAQCT